MASAPAVEVIAALAQRKGVTSVRLSRVFVSVSALRLVLAQPTLRKLVLHHVTIGSTAERPSEISATQVRKLQIDGCAFAEGCCCEFLDLVSGIRQLENVKLADFRGPTEHLCELLAVFNQCSELKSVDFDDCHLNEVRWTGQLSSVRWEHLQELHLPRNDLTAVSLAALLTALPAQLSLSTLDLTTNRLCDSGVSVFVAWAARVPVQLHRLSLSDNLITSLGACVLASFLRTQTCLRVLYLACNPLTDRGLQEVVAAIRETPMQTLDLSTVRCSGESFGSACGLQGVETLSLAGNKMTVASKLAEIRLLGTVQRLSLAGCLIGDTGIARLAHGSAALLSLKTLDLTTCAITANGAEALSDLLRKAGKLRELLLGENSLGSEGVVRLKHSFACLSELKAIDLKGNYIGTAGAEAIADCLRSFPRLRSLKLTENQIGNEGLAALSAHFEHIPLLTSLHMADNRIDSRVFPVFAPALSRLKLLRYLHIGRNRLSDSGLALLLPVLAALSSLKTVSISYTLISDETTPPLFECISTLPFLSQISCDGNKLNAEFLECIGKCKSLRCLSARKNEFTSGREPVRWDLVLEMNLAYSKVSAFESPSPTTHCEALRLSGCTMLTSTWNQLFSQCGTHLRVLELDDDHLKAEGLGGLFARSGFLRELSLSNALLDSLQCGWEALGRSLERLTMTHVNTLSASLPVRSILMSLPHLRRLAFTHNTLNPRDQSETLLAISFLSSLEELEIGNLRHRTKFSLSDALQHLPSLRVLHLSTLTCADRKLAYSLRKATKLETLVLRNFTDFGFIEELGTTLSVLHLNALELSGCIMTAQQVSKLCDGLASQWGLRSFTVANCKIAAVSMLQVLKSIEAGGVQLVDIDISGNQLCFADISPIVSFLASQTLLKDLRANGLCLDESQSQVFGAALGSTAIRVLSVDGGQVKGLEGLVREIREMRCLASLYISNCGITDEGLGEIVQGVEGMLHLDSLYANFNKLTATVLPVLCSLCLQKQLTLSLRGNTISVQDLDEAISLFRDPEDRWFLEDRISVR